MAVHVDHLEAPAAPVELLARAGDVTEAVEHSVDADGRLVGALNSNDLMRAKVI